LFYAKKDEVSLQLTLKSYFSAIALSLHKSRNIIPNVLVLLKKRKELNNSDFKEIIKSIKVNLEQLPVWIWIFWVPQIITLLGATVNPLEL
jgi:hypothetical protein